jgi:hypothetical protein
MRQRLLRSGDHNVLSVVSGFLHSDPVGKWYINAKIYVL